MRRLMYRYEIKDQLGLPNCDEWSNLAVEFLASTQILSPEALKEVSEATTAITSPADHQTEYMQQRWRTTDLIWLVAFVQVTVRMDR